MRVVRGIEYQPPTSCFAVQIYPFPPTDHIAFRKEVLSGRTRLPRAETLEQQWEASSIGLLSRESTDFN